MADLIKIRQLVIIVLAKRIKVLDLKALAIACKCKLARQVNLCPVFFRQFKIALIRIFTGQIPNGRDLIFDRDRLPGGAVLRRYFDRILEVDVLYSKFSALLVVSRTI